MSNEIVLLWDVIEVSPGEFEIYTKHSGKPSLVSFVNGAAMMITRVSKEKVEWYIEQMRTIYSHDEDVAHLPVMFHWVYLPKGK